MPVAETEQVMKEPTSRTPNRLEPAEEAAKKIKSPQSAPGVSPSHHAMMRHDTSLNLHDLNTWVALVPTGRRQQATRINRLLHSSALLCSAMLTRHVLSGGVDAGEGTGGLHHVVGSGVAPLDVSGVHLAVHLSMFDGR